jgi:hypothetical protein
MKTAREALCICASLADRLLLAVCFYVMFSCFGCMVRGMQIVSLRKMGMMRSFLMRSRLMVIGGFAVVACCFLMVLGSLMVMFAGLL